jgi:photosystem II stability/assembly factor-like uncharacterized protein
MAIDTTGYKWRILPNAPVAKSRTDDIWFNDRSTGWLVNGNGQIQKTTDGGATGTPQLPPPAVEGLYMRCIAFANANVGWAGTLTAPQLLFHTENGGDDWLPVDNLPAGTPLGICGISVVSPSVVYGSGTNDPANDPAIIKTTDGGATWTAIDMRPHAKVLIDIHFFDEQHGLVVGGKQVCASPNPSYRPEPDDEDTRLRGMIKAVVLRTRDGGATWQNLIEDLTPCLPCGEWGWKIQFLDEAVGFVALESLVTGAILKTTDCGQTWTRHPVNDEIRPDEDKLGPRPTAANANLEGIGFIDEKTGWVGGWGDIQFTGNFNSVTRDGGETWAAEDFLANAQGEPILDPDGNPAGDVRQNVNRYRFFHNPLVGYCSGRTVYKYSKDPVETPPTLRAASAASGLGFKVTGQSDGSTTLGYTLPADAKSVSLRIWNSFGWAKRQLVSEENPEGGEKVVTWDGRDDAGEPLPSGAYILRVTVDENAESLMVHL